MEIYAAVNFPRRTNSRRCTKKCNPDRRLFWPPPPPPPQSANPQPFPPSNPLPHNPEEAAASRFRLTRHSKKLSSPRVPPRMDQVHCVFFSVCSALLPSQSHSRLYFLSSISKFLFFFFLPCECFHLTFWTLLDGPSSFTQDACVFP